MVLIAYDLVGTILADGCLEERVCMPRKGFTSCLRRQKALGWDAAIFSTERSEDVQDLITRGNLEGAFSACYAQDCLDSEGMHNLSFLDRKHAWVVFVGGTLDDSKAAAKYGVSLVRVPRFASIEDEFDFGRVQELVEALVLDCFAEYAALHQLKESAPEPHVKEWSGEKVWLRVTRERFEAQFY